MRIKQDNTSEHQGRTWYTLNGTQYQFLFTLMPNGNANYFIHPVFEIPTGLLLHLSSKFPLLWYTSDSDISPIHSCIEMLYAEYVYKSSRTFSLCFSCPGIPVLRSCILILYTLLGWWKINLARSKLNSSLLFLIYSVFSPNE